MPFTAIKIATGERVDLTLYDMPKIEFLGHQFSCPVCGARMRIRHGFKVRAHFYHVLSDDCIYARYSAGESAEHKAAKEWLVATIRQEIGEFFPEAEILLEYHVPEAGRIADVAVLYPGGYIHAYEIQLSAITIESLEARHQSYLAAGCDITWLVGNHADKPDVVKWLIDNQGEAPVINVELRRFQIEN